MTVMTIFLEEKKNSQKVSFSTSSEIRQLFEGANQALLNFRTKQLSWETVSDTSFNLGQFKKSRCSFFSFNSKLFVKEIMKIML